MSVIDEIKNQMKGDDKNLSDSALPWTMPESETGENTSLLQKYDTKKLATIGIVILIVIISCFAVFKFIFGGSSVSVDTGEAEAEEVVSEIQVHVAGEVNNPGLYKLKDGSRVWDAVQAAGGFTKNADQNSLNLAKTLEDGEQVMIPAIGGTSSSGEASGSNNGKVNINTADLATLETLSGVGPATAQKIIDYRNAHGKFKSIEEIKKVSGIGEKTYEKFKDKICV